MIFLQEMEQPPGVIRRQRIGRLEDNATVIAAAPATHLLLVNALHHSSEVDCSA